MGDIAQQRHPGERDRDSCREQITDAARGDSHHQDVAIVAPAHFRAEKHCDEGHVENGAGQNQFVGGAGVRVRRRQQSFYRSESGDNQPEARGNPEADDCKEIEWQSLLRLIPEIAPDAAKKA